ncbi:MAG: aminotransferase class I/II-fold pyridoxal phosphate-dependent enzyme [Acidimicrobiia bacterium]|nr:aminotransferase class I/II-fold pyridoxal phosphate-dependent enzyme [Acidimicrobiia bacterium]MDH5237109.1 aminotransferase class I/II-fold pyridoxal phosphate-dependent enzyme [Acidimicrobiia bacterium]
MPAPLPPSERSDIAPFYVMEVMRAADERVRRGDEVLHLEVGQPSTPAPAAVRRAAHEALDADVLGYTVALGSEALRRRISAHYADWYGLDVEPDRIVVTAGASAGCVLGFLAAFDPGARVAVSEPGYPCYRHMLTTFGVEVVPLAVDETTRFQPAPAQLREVGPLDGIVVASPSNPTGTMLRNAEMAELLAHCASERIRVFSDEIYHGITFGQAAATAAVDPDAIVVNSFSKYFSMTGWRLGWLVLPEPLLTAVERLGQNLYIAPSTLSQHAAIAAFDCHDELAGNVARYARNRQILLDGLPRAGIDRLAPADGAFYIYADVSALTDDSTALCARWLEELGVAATPGIDFDPVRGSRFIRFSFAGRAEDMTEAVRRLESRR